MTELPSDTFADFRILAEAAIRKGFRIHPCKPRGKEPWLKNWPQKASTDPAVIGEWAIRFPNSNYGVVADEHFCILESDDFTTLMDSLGRAIPRTYTVQARNNRPHLYFRQTDATRALGNLDLAGVFEFKQRNKYVLGAGSIHPTGKVYEVEHDQEVIPIPDWLVNQLPKLKGAEKKAAPRFRRQTGRMYGEGEGRHPLLVSEAARLWVSRNGVTPTREEMLEKLEAVNQESCDPPRSEGHLLSIIDWVMEQEPIEKCARLILSGRNYKPVNVPATVVLGEDGKWKTK